MDWEHILSEFLDALVKIYSVAGSFTRVKTLQEIASDTSFLRQMHIQVEASTLIILLVYLAEVHIHSFLIRMTMRTKDVGFP